jgi:hypothetical protein
MEKTRNTSGKRVEWRKRQGMHAEMRGGETLNRCARGESRKRGISNAKKMGWGIRGDVYGDVKEIPQEIKGGETGQDFATPKLIVPDSIARPNEGQSVIAGESLPLRRCPTEIENKV